MNTEYAELSDDYMGLSGDDENKMESIVDVVNSRYPMNHIGRSEFIHELIISLARELRKSNDEYYPDSLISENVIGAIDSVDS